MTTRIISLATVRHRAAGERTGTARTWVGRVADWLVAADRRYRERRYLEEMDEAQLRDIGLTREDLGRAFRDPGAFGRR